MPTFSFSCTKCDKSQDVFLTSYTRIKEYIQVNNCCGEPVKQIISTPPVTVIPHHMQSAPTSKTAYYGIKDPITGAGVENLKEGWNDGPFKVPKPNSANTPSSD